MKDSEIAATIRQAVPDVVAIYRFGSTVEGSEHQESDIDLAFLPTRPLDPVRRFEIQELLAVALRRDVDLVDLRAASTVMRMQVIAHGVVLAVFDLPEQERFEMYVYSSYARLNEERKAIVEQVVRDGTVYGR